MRVSRLAPWWSLILIFLAPPLIRSAEPFDIAPFARRCCAADRHTSQVEFDYQEARRARTAAEKASDGRYIYGLQWAEERDVDQLRVRFRKSAPASPAEVQYWFRNWPYSPPHMPSMEDPVDDPWQGKWLNAVTRRDCREETCSYTFAPLAESENPLAKNLPGLTYRRTLKVRLVFHSEPSIEKVEVFSGSTERRMEVRLQLGAGETAAHTWEGNLRLYNARLTNVRVWNAGPGDRAEANHFLVRTSGTSGTAKGLILGLVVTEPSLPGSNDASIVTFQSAGRTFSFATGDVQKAPVYVPDDHVYVTLASEPKPFSPGIVKKGEKIREKLAREPEQTYERARREIPALDPTEREGERLYLPLAADASWQKFALEWDGNVHISKQGTKAKGRELEKLEWQGDRIAWRIGTGASPDYRPGWKDSTLSVLNDDLPITTAKWTTDGIEYTEEGYATLLSGPLDPDDSERSEETPAVLMLKLEVRNPGDSGATANVWLATSPAEKVAYQNNELLAGDNQLVRALFRWPEAAKVGLATVPDGNEALNGIHVEIPLGGKEEQTVFIRLPFIPRLSSAEQARLAELDYEQERSRVMKYWRTIVDHVIPFDVPEARFDSFAKAVIAHIHISATKDPESGLYMVPAASYYYQVYADEAAFQCVMLDALGDHQSAARYLKTLVALQGSAKFDGTFTGDQKAVYHGARVNAAYDYTASQYNLDHGAVLWALAEHYFYSRDKAWLNQTAPSMKRAADWIIAQRALTRVLDGGEKIPEYGLLPAGHLEDNSDWGHWFAVNDFAAAGMAELAGALADVRDPSASHYAQEAAAYRQDLRDAILRAAQAAPVVRLRDNTYIPWFGPRPYERIRLYGPIRVAFYSRYPQKVLPIYRLSETREILYGPMIHLTLNIFGAEEPVAHWVLDDWEDNATLSSSLGLNVHGWVDDRYWFSRGGMVFQANLQNPVLAYLRRHEIPAEIRNLYNDFVACHYPDVNAFTEEYHQWIHGAGPFYKVPDEARFVNRVRDTLVLEQGDSLWLASGTPRRWLAPGQRIAVHNLATYYGPVSYEIEGAQDRATATVELPARNPYREAWLVVRNPDARPLRAVEIDGKPWTQFDAAKELVRLPHRSGKMNIVVHYQ
ncbi:MAG TPA: hypothetical protein VG204_05355 [Terriglobia bacterium]|nr:hypothetical protein [Terriglobia bacterium]